MDYRIVSLLLLCWILRCCSGYQRLSDDTFELFVNSLPGPLSTYLDPHHGSILEPILIPRVSGSEGAETVRRHFESFFTSNLSDGWVMEREVSEQWTPLERNVTFVNFVATKDPPRARVGDVGRLVLAAHYDSKIFPPGQTFVGATDSAVPCAILMYTALALDRMLDAKWKQAAAERDDLDDDILDNPVGLQIIFFDGEEAVKDWTDQDSIYGAKSLAAKWDSTLHAAHSTRRSNISSIDLLVLLDLLGVQSPQIPSYFPTTHWAYNNLASIEDRLRRSTGHFSSITESSEKWFHDQGDRYPTFGYRGRVEDDHVPFMERGVETLHIIPVS